MRSIMHTLPAMALTLTLALTGLQSRAAMPDYVTPEQTYQLAREARTERNYPAMLEMLRLAAEGGDLRAQEMLSSVLLAGPSLYGDAIQANPCEADLWARRAATQHSEVARHHKALLNGMREVRGGRAGCADR